MAKRSALRQAGYGPELDQMLNIKGGLEANGQPGPIGEGLQQHPDGGSTHKLRVDTEQNRNGWNNYKQTMDDFIALVREQLPETDNSEETFAIQGKLTANAQERSKLIKAGKRDETTGLDLEDQSLNRRLTELSAPDQWGTEINQVLEEMFPGAAGAYDDFDKYIAFIPGFKGFPRKKGEPSPRASSAMPIPKDRHTLSKEVLSSRPIAESEVGRNPNRTVTYDITKDLPGLAGGLHELANMSDDEAVKVFGGDANALSAFRAYKTKGDWLAERGREKARAAELGVEPMFKEGWAEINKAGKAALPVLNAFLDNKRGMSREAAKEVSGIRGSSAALRGNGVVDPFDPMINGNPTVDAGDEHISKPLEEQGPMTKQEQVAKAVQDLDPDIDRWGNVDRKQFDDLFTQVTGYDRDLMGAMPQWLRRTQDKWLTYPDPIAAMQQKLDSEGGPVWDESKKTKAFARLLNMIKSSSPLSETADRTYQYPKYHAAALAMMRKMMLDPQHRGVFDTGDINRANEIFGLKDTDVDGESLLGKWQAFIDKGKAAKAAIQPKTGKVGVPDEAPSTKSAFTSPEEAEAFKEEHGSRPAPQIDDDQLKDLNSLLHRKY